MRYHRILIPPLAKDFPSLSLRQSNRELGLVGVQENGSGEGGRKNKYKRMDSEPTKFDDDNIQLHQDRRHNTRKYVLACAVFASLNNVLLGYGKLFLICRW